MGSFNFTLPSSVTSLGASTSSGINSSIYSSTSDADLTYTGDDPIVWDRVNAERLKRGLPSLTSLGYPRPVDTAASTPATASTGTVTISGPSTLTEAQAREIFEKQLNAGSFVGLKSGDILNAAKQAAGGLPGAFAQASQAISTLGSTAQSFASKAVSTVTNLTKGAGSITDGINIADVAKQASAVMPIGQVSVPTLTAGLAGASKLVGQASTAMSNTLGAGKFGLDVAQLEAAGIVKPGVNAKLVQTGLNEFTAVLSSPSVFTGKLGINNVDDLLGSVAKQDLIQQDLMKTGSAALKQLGVPIDSLDPGKAMATIMNAAKSIPGSEKWLSGAAMPADLKSQFDKLAQNTDFAATFDKLKVDASMKAEIIPIPAIDTVNRETLNAASSRVIGNAKVPAVDYSADTGGVSASTFAETYQEVDITFNRIKRSWQDPIKQATDKSQYPDLIKALEVYISDLNALDGKALDLIRYTIAIEKKSGFAPPQKAQLEKLRTDIASLIAKIQQIIDQKKADIESSTA